ncbi:radical SAM protein [Chloroflexota bacterium]
MSRYDNLVVIRPPSEAYSFLLPVTIGCSNNRCTFCGSYLGIQFQIRDFADIKADIDEVARSYSSSVRRIFLENGDALIVPQPLLVQVLEYLNQKFPYLERVGTYATPKSVLKKSPEQLQELHRLGLKIAYLGVETGDEELLLRIDKGVTYAQMLAAGKKLKQSGIVTSVTVILGLGGVEGSERHALATARILTEIDPDYVGALTIMLVPGTPLYQEWKEGNFSLITPLQALRELKLIIENSHFTNCFFTANHASNYLPIKAQLPQQQEAVIRMLEEILDKQDMSRLRPESVRAL